MLKIEDLRECLSPDLDLKRKSRFEIAFRSLGYQDDYCRYHYEQYHKEHKLYISAMRGKLSSDKIQNPQYYRIAFEANCIAFFRAFHSLIESIPYLLNLLIEINDNAEFSRINWDYIIKSRALYDLSDGVNKIRELRAYDSYKELEHIVNVSKHRRIVRIDSGIFSEDKSPHFCAEDFDEKFRSYQVENLMETIFNDLHPKSLAIINCFVIKSSRHS